MIAPIDFSLLQSALELPRGWIELGVTLLCLAVAWIVERRIERADRAVQSAEPEAPATGSHRLHSVALRLAFPLLGLVLVYLVASLWRRHVGAPFFLAIAAPLLFTLAGIRMLVYALRRLFPGEGWQRASELAIVAAAWSLAALYFFGILGDLGAALAEIVIPIGKGQVTMLTIVEGIVVVIVALIVALWVSSLVERRLAGASQIDPNLRVVFANIVRIA